MPLLSVDVLTLLTQLRAAEPLAASLTTEDRARLTEIDNLVAKQPLTAADAIHAYYSDMDRAARTPRPFLYLHLGVLIGIIERSQNR